MLVKLDLGSSVKMVNLFSKKFLIRGLEIGEIIPFPVQIISFPVCKTGFGLLRKNGTYSVEEVIWSEVWRYDKIPFPFCLIPFPVCKTGFGLLIKNSKQAGAELCQAQPQAVLAGFPLASGQVV